MLTHESVMQIYKEPIVKHVERVPRDNTTPRKPPSEKHVKRVLKIVRTMRSITRQNIYDTIKDVSQATISSCIRELDRRGCVSQKTVQQAERKRSTTVYFVKGL
mgnify:CR=1 FL=1